MKTASDILKAMDNMDKGERIKLLKELSVKHFGFKELTPEEIAKLNYEAMHGEEGKNEDW